MFSKAEKEKRIIELYEQDKTYREIAKEVHESLSTISSVVKKHKGEETPQQKSVDSRAFALFEAGRTPVQVAIELDLNAEEVSRLNKDWWQLKGLQDLSQVYDEVREDIHTFVDFFKQAKNAGMSPHHMVSTLLAPEQLPHLESRIRALQDDSHRFEYWNRRAEENLRDMNSQITAASEELAKVNRKRQELEGFINQLKKDDKGYLWVSSVAKENACQVLSDNRGMLNAVIHSVLAALNEIPGLWQYRQACPEDLLKEVHDRLANSIVGNVISAASSSGVRGQSYRNLH